MGLHTRKAGGTLVAGGNRRTLEAGASGGKTAALFYHLPLYRKEALPCNIKENAPSPPGKEDADPKRIGDWKGDTVYGGVGKGLLVTLVDRKSRFLCAGLLAKRNALLTQNTVVKLLCGLPVESISLDNGSEFSEFHTIERELNAPVYFAEPHKPWQRGTNENMNGILRFYFPKGCDFHRLTQDELDAVVRQINARPRKCLGWKSPAEVFFAQPVALD